MDISVLFSSNTRIDSQNLTILVVKICIVLRVRATIYIWKTIVLYICTYRDRYILQRFSYVVIFLSEELGVIFAYLQLPYPKIDLLTGT